MQLFGELSQTSRDSFESDSDSTESRDDWLNSPKSGKNENATFEGIKPNVPRFFRIGFRFERILGHSAYFTEKWQK